MEELSRRQVLLGPCVVTCAMLLAALWVSIEAGISGTQVLIDYVFKGVAITFLCTLIAMFIEVSKMAFERAEKPLLKIWLQLPKRMDLIILPAVLFPIFLSGFTTTKTGIPFLVSFRWDQFWTNLDYKAFGVDPWKITHALFGAGATKLFNFFYTFIWGMVLAFSQSFVAIYARRQYVAQFFTAMLLTWFFGGFIGAYLLSSAGPVFAHLADPAMASRFADLRVVLDQTLPPEGGVRATQSYLAHAINSKIAVRGGGISAMPSMHVAAATIFVLAAKGRGWTLAALLFWFATYIGSVHFGYHYALDGLVGAIFAILCWLLTTRIVAIISGDGAIFGREKSPAATTA